MYQHLLIPPYCNRFVVIPQDNSTRIVYKSPSNYVGIIAHVLVNDPSRGYGIFIDNMLDAAG